MPLFSCHLSPRKAGTQGWKRFPPTRSASRCHSCILFMSSCVSLCFSSASHSCKRIYRSLRGPVHKRWLQSQAGLTGKLASKSTDAFIRLPVHLSVLGFKPNPLFTGKAQRQHLMCEAHTKVWMSASAGTWIGCWWFTKRHISIWKGFFKSCLSSLLLCLCSVWMLFLPKESHQREFWKLSDLKNPILKMWAQFSTEPQNRSS